MEDLKVMVKIRNEFLAKEDISMNSAYIMGAIMLGYSYGKAVSYDFIKDFNTNKEQSYLHELVENTIQYLKDENIEFSHKEGITDISNMTIKRFNILKKAIANKQENPYMSREAQDLEIAVIGNLNDNPEVTHLFVPFKDGYCSSSGYFIPTEDLLTKIAYINIKEEV